MTTVFADCQRVRNIAQDEYAHKDANALANFERLAGELSIHREQVLWIYLRKHLDGMLAWVKGFKSQREDVRGRIKDMIVYGILLWSMADDEDEAWAQEGSGAGGPPPPTIQFDQYNFDKSAVLINAREFVDGYNPIEGGEYGAIVLEGLDIQVVIKRIHPKRDALES